MEEIKFEKTYDDGTHVIIAERNGVRSFGAIGPNVNKYLHLANEYQCNALIFNSYAMKLSIDLKIIANKSLINSLEIYFTDDCELEIDKEQLSEFAELRRLSLDQGSPKFMPDISAYRNLKYLKIKYDKKNLSWMNNERIEDLVVFKYKESDLSRLSGMTSIKRLNLTSGLMSSLDGIETLPCLKTLIIHGGRNLIDALAIVKSKKLESISFESFAKIKNWEFLSQSKSLSYLNLEVAESIDFISNMPHLQFANFHRILDKDQLPLNQHAGIRAWQDRQRELIDKYGKGNLPPYLTPEP